MTHDSKNIDQQLRDLESQSLPDLSKIDQHWQQMKTQLVPSAPAPAKSPFNYGVWAIGAAVGVVIVALSLSIGKKEKRDEAPREVAAMVTQQPVTEPVPESHPQSVLQDTVPAKKARPTLTRKTPKVATTPRETAETKAMADTAVRPKKAVPVKRTYKAPRPALKTHYKVPTKKRVLLKARTTDGRDTVLEATIIEEIKVQDTLKPGLEQFFSKLEKESPQFTITNNRDTVRVGRFLGNRHFKIPFTEITPEPSKREAAKLDSLLQQDIP